MATLANITTTAATTTATKAATKAAPKEAAPKEARKKTPLELLFEEYHAMSAAAKAARGEASALTRAAALKRAEILGLCLNPPEAWKTTAKACCASFKTLGKLSEVESAVLRGARLA